ELGRDERAAAGLGLLVDRLRAVALHVGLDHGRTARVRIVTLDARVRVQAVLGDAAHASASLRTSARRSMSALLRCSVIATSSTFSLAAWPGLTPRSAQNSITSAAGFESVRANSRTTGWSCRGSTPSI